MKYFILLLFFLLANSNAFSQYIFKKILSLPYGTKDNEILIRKENDGSYGPAGISIANNSIYILDKQNNRLKMFSEDGLLLKSLSVPPLSGYFTVSGDNLYILCDQSGLTRINLQVGNVISRQEIKTNSKPIVEMHVKGNFIELKNSRDEYQTYNINELSKSALNEINSSDLKKSKIIRMNSSKAVFYKIGPGDQIQSSFVISEETNRLASINFLESDKYENYYFNEEVFITETPCAVERFLLKYNRDGEFLLKIKIPEIYYSAIEKDIFISQEGDIYHLLSNKECIDVIKWEFTPGAANSRIILYPEEYNFKYHFNQDVFEIRNKIQNNDINSYPEKISVYRDESVQIGDTYVNYKWECRANNLTSGEITAPDGLKIRTPEWMVIGQNIKVPYKWGGFNTLQEFTYGLSSKYAGDRYTSKSYGSSYAIGVDCSGFVSRCWKLSQHYSTSMMVTKTPLIMSLLPSWSNIQRGDAVHKVGHVRLCVDNNSNGTINVVEAAGADWRVSYRMYNYTGLTGYSPYKFNSMQENSQSGINESLETAGVVFNNYPNPFNNSTRIVFSAPGASNVKIKIMDLLGRNVKNYPVNQSADGSCEFYWEGKDNNGKEVTSGTYFGVLTYTSKDNKSVVMTNKLFLLK